MPWLDEHLSCLLRGVIYFAEKREKIFAIDGVYWGSLCYDPKYVVLLWDYVFWDPYLYEDCICNPTDLGLSHVTCFGQQNVRRMDTGHF